MPFLLFSLNYIHTYTDLEDFARNLHQDTIATAKALRDDRREFIQEYLSDIKWYGEAIELGENINLLLL